MGKSKWRRREVFSFQGGVGVLIKLELGFLFFLLALPPLCVYTDGERFLALAGVGLHGDGRVHLVPE